jgi:hypothetical protein
VEDDPLADCAAISAPSSASFCTFREKDSDCRRLCCQNQRCHWGRSAQEAEQTAVDRLCRCILGGKEGRC